MSTVLERLTEAQNAHDVDLFTSFFTHDYQSEQPAHPGRRFSGPAQVHENWSSVFTGVPDFRAELLFTCREGDVEWGEVSWRGHHSDGAGFAMCGVIIATIRDGRIAAARLYVEPVETDEEGIAAAVEQLYRPPPAYLDHVEEPGRRRTAAQTSWDGPPLVRSIDDWGV